MQNGLKILQLGYHAEAILASLLVGHTAVRFFMEMLLLISTVSIEIIYLIGCANEKVYTREGRMDRYTFVGARYLKRMEELGLYTTNINKINNRVKKINLDNIFEQKPLG